MNDLHITIMYFYFKCKAIFIDDAIIKNALNDSYKRCNWKETSHCNSFVAQDSGGKKTFKEGIFDENAIGGTICCHQFIHDLVNLSEGEKLFRNNFRYIYFKECLKKLINKIEQTKHFKESKIINPTIVAGYDIMCVFIEHLKV